MKFTNRLSILLIAAMISACGLTPPKPNESEYFKSVGGGFMYLKEEKEARYGLTVASKGNVVPGNFVEVLYDNPMGGEPLASSHLIKDNETQFNFQSPPVNGLKAYTNYTVQIYLYEDNTKTKLLGTHVQGLQNLVNQADLGW